MSLYLLEMFIKIIRMIFVAFISIFNINIYSENENIQENTIVNQKNYAMNVVVINNKNEQKNLTKKTITKLKNDSKKTSTKNIAKNNTTNIKKSTTLNNNKKILTNTKTTVALEEYTGRLTGYGPDCVGCTGTGNLACKTKEKRTFSLVKDGIYYTDEEYGKVRILSAATTKFKCGTIVVVTKQGMEPFVGIVLDTGGSMRKAWSNGKVWMDLAYSSNAMAGSDKLTGKNVKFSVQRWGW